MVSESFQLGIYQCDLSWENTPQNLQHLENALSQHPPKSFDLVVMPEMFSTGFTMKPQGIAINEQAGALDHLHQIAARFQTHLAASFIFKDHTGGYQNRFLLINGEKIVGHYDKKHLFALGKETETYQAGTLKASWEICGWKILPLVCYDLRFPEWCRNDAEYDLTLFTANWPQARSHHWKTLLTARAIENQCYVAGVNRIGTDGNSLHYSGDSLVINANGETLYNAEKKESLQRVVLSHSELVEFRKKYPFLKDRLK